jgi:hypothetical protein
MKINLQIVAGIVGIVAIFALLLVLPADSGRANTQVAEGLEPGALQPPEEKIEYSISIATDKYTYHARDPVLLTINVTVPGEMNDSQIKFYGIKNKYGAYKVKRTDDMPLVKGLNVIETKTNLPSCYGCSGIKPGIFYMHAALIENGTKIVNATTEIEILE